jgi:hypothetical protein
MVDGCVADPARIRVILTTEVHVMTATASPSSDLTAALDAALDSFHRFIEGICG